MPASSTVSQVLRLLAMSVVILLTPFVLSASLAQPSTPGVVARYFADHSYNSLKKSVVVPTLALDWSSPPVAPLDGKRFWVEWEGLLSVPAKGQYNFKIEGDGNGFLYIDGTRVIRDQELVGNVRLAAGTETVLKVVLKEDQFSIER